MSVDFEAIARRGRCDVSSLRLALPLLEQGYTPPFLARYRRDELGGADETSLWNLLSAIRNEQAISDEKDRLHSTWQETTLQDPAIGHAIKKAASLRVLSRLGRRLKNESSQKITDADRLAVRLLNPRKGDGDDLTEIAVKVDGITDADAAIAGLDQALGARLAGDPRIIASAVRWFTKHAKIKIAKIHDPHLNQEQQAATDSTAKPDAKSTPPEQTGRENASAAQAEQSVTIADETENEAAAGAPPESATESIESTATPPNAAENMGVVDSPETAESAASGEAPSESSPTQLSSGQLTEDETAADKTTTSSQAPTDQAESDLLAQGDKDRDKPAPSAKSEKPAAKKAKKVSPRQRRRRWLVSVLKPLQGKSFAGDKLSAFQMVMLGRALRSEVAVCEFVYDAAKLVAELRRTTGSINRVIEAKLAEIVLQNESTIREAAESLWWDDLQERSSTRLVSVTAATLRDQINRGAIDAKVVLSIDAVGPRTAASTIVSADGRLLHSEDLPCQLSVAQRSATVARIGELIHQHHVDLIVVSNGPARRSIVVAVGDLIKQSPEKSIRWTLAERGGADVYSSSSIADQEMRSTPRRFRAAAWLAFSILQPAQAMAKVDPLKLRLSSFQRELSDEALRPVLEDIMVSGASRGGVDVNSAPSSWLRRLPGVTESVATAIDQRRRSRLFDSRDSLLELDAWTSETESRQALPFLRVFNSEETLDGTLIHPSDYAIAKRLAKTLSIELPPGCPPCYEAPDYSKSTASTESESAEVKPIEVVQQEEPAMVEDFSAPNPEVKEFAIGSDAVDVSDQASKSNEPETGEPPTVANEPVASEEPAPAEAGDEETDTAATATDSAEPRLEASTTTEPEISADSEVTSESATSDEASVQTVKQRLPEKAAIEKCIKEWQIGKKRTHQIVHWLCDPFGDSDSTGNAPGVLTKVPAMSSLTVGERVVGVVVGVMPFGVFVELAPDCSGLIHVSRVSDTYVEDLHEAVQVGDVITAYVTGIDEKKRRVGLSTLSPQREAELGKERKEKSQRGPRGGHGQERRGGNRGGPGSAGRGGPGRDSSRHQGPAGGRSGAKGGDGQRGGKGRGDANRGRGKPNRGDGRSRDRRGGKSRGRQPESYRVEAKKEEKPITDAMKTGDEPLRSFGDLAQLLGATKKKAEPSKVTPATKQPETPVEPEIAADSTPPVQASTNQSPTPPETSTEPKTESTNE